MTTERTQSFLPMYVSYATFITFLDWVKEMAVMPSQIDRSLWGPKFQGGTGGQLMVGLRFLKLLDGEQPTDTLDELAHADSAARGRLLQNVLRDAYGNHVIDNLVRYTPKMLNDQLDALGSTESTRRKAFSFLVNAARAAGLPIAPAVAKQARNKTPRLKPTGGRKGGAKNTHIPTGEGKPASNNGDRPPAQQAQANIRTVQLNSGGQVTLSLSVDLFLLSETDRTFVLSLVDTMREYTERQKPLELAAPSPAVQEAV